MFATREERLDYENWQLQREINRMPDPCLNPCEGIEQAYDRQRADIERLTEENRLLVEFVEAEWAVGAGIVGYDLHNAAVERFRAANEAVKPILQRHREAAGE